MHQSPYNDKKDTDTAADLLAQAVRQKRTRPARWTIWLRQTQTLTFLGGAIFLLLMIFSFAFGQKAFLAAVDQRVGVFGTFAPSLTPTVTATLTPTGTITIMPVLMPSLTNTFIQTATFTPSAGSTSLPRDDGMIMVYIPAGTFKMGSNDGAGDERPIHDVTLDAFWMDQSEVTNVMYKKCVDVGVCQPPIANYRFGDLVYDNFPVADVDWDRAKIYCEWAGGNAKNVHLPSEAQWEYAARGGLSQEPYPWGSEIPSCTPGAKNGANFYSCKKNGAVAVKTFSPNGYGLYDMAGNVWEWTNDWYGADYYKNSPANNPLGPENGLHRVLRGGSWFYNGGTLRVSDRGYWDNPDFPFIGFGFRCSRSR